jgi:hypothetical protein
MDSSERDVKTFERIKYRLESTPNEKLETVLRSLLPKLVLMISDNEAQNNVIIDIINCAVERFKLFKVELPILELLVSIKPENLSLSSELAIKIIDLNIENQLNNSNPEQCKNMCKVILGLLSKYPISSEESDSFCYYAFRLLSYLPTESIEFTKGLEILGDYFFDISLLQKETVAGTLGSISPG